MAKNKQNTGIGARYMVSDRTAIYLDCIQELNNLTTRIANNSSEMDFEQLEPIMHSANSIQNEIITKLIPDSITEAIGGCVKIEAL